MPKLIRLKTVLTMKTAIETSKVTFGHLQNARDFPALVAPYFLSIGTNATADAGELMFRTTNSVPEQINRLI